MRVHWGRVGVIGSKWAMLALNIVADFGGHGTGARFVAVSGLSVVSD